MGQATQDIIAVRQDHCLVITLNRPDRRNALRPQDHARLAQLFDEFAANDALRVALITGQGSLAFCAGSDLADSQLGQRSSLPETGFAGLAERFHLDKPVIAAINGDAIGGGLEIVLACDLALAVPTARFGLPEPRVGLAATGGLHRLARAVPAKLANEVALTGQLFPADRALQMGLINQLVEPAKLMEAAGQLAAQIAELAPLSVQATKQMLQKGLDKPGLAAAFAAPYPALDRMLASEDAKEGPRAFLEKRAPVWKGK